MQVFFLWYHNLLCLSLNCKLTNKCKKKNYQLVEVNKAIISSAKFVNNPLAYSSVPAVNTWNIMWIPTLQYNCMSKVKLYKRNLWIFHFLPFTQQTSQEFRSNRAVKLNFGKDDFWKLYNSDFTAHSLSSKFRPTFTNSLFPVHRLRIFFSAAFIYMMDFIFLNA